MNHRGILWASVMLLLFMCSRLHSTAQSVLPTIDAVADSGLVTLRWVCQYDGVKSITVKRSTDSNANFSIIGHVKDVTKGAQHYTDFAPMVGVGYYKLSIVFNSGLSWSSNFCEAVSYKSHTLLHSGTLPSQPHNITVTSPVPATTVIHAEQQPKLTVRLSYPDIDMNDASFIQPRFVFIHKVFGHAVLKLPVVNFKQHVYSVRFSTISGVGVVDIPFIKMEEIIIDKRNFGRSGTYKYVIRRDGVLFESGCIKVTM